MSISIVKRGKAKRMTRETLRHKPSGLGDGKWHSRAAFWNYKRKSRRLRKIADASRRANRAA